VLSSEPEQNDDQGVSDLSTIEGTPSMCFTVHCVGSVPESLLSQSLDPCWTLLIWYSLSYKGPLIIVDDDADEKPEDAPETSTSPQAALSEDAVVQRLPSPAGSSPVSAALANDGKFFVPILCPPILDEGLFELEVKLGCKDVTGQEWEIPVVDDSSRSIAVRIALSR